MSIPNGTVSESVYCCILVILTISVVICPVNSFISVTGFFFTTTSSFIYGVLMTCISSPFNGISINCLEVIDFCIVEVSPVGILRSN